MLSKVALSKIELPRLGLTFTVAGGGGAAGGELPRLMCADPAGWFVSDARPSGVGAGLHHVLVLANAAGDAQLLIPNSRVERVVCGDAPLSAE